MIESMENHQLIQFSFFQGLSDLELDQLKSMMEFCCLPVDMVLFEQETLANFIYILLEGEVGIEYKPYDGPPSIIARILPGNIFGWSAALKRKKYSTSARTLTTCSVYRIETRKLTNLCDQYPAIAHVFLDRLAGVITDHFESPGDDMAMLLLKSMVGKNECQEGNS